jgi:crotonobetaine/carnitine-CoA ligase
MSWLALDDPRERLLGRALRRQAELRPDAPFLLEDTRVHRYGEVNARANAFAAGLRRLGVARGDTVALLLESTPDCVVAALGANKLGAVWVPTNTDYKGVWLREALEGSRAQVLVADAVHLPRLAELGALPFRHVVVRRGAPDAARAPAVAGGDSALRDTVAFDELLAGPAPEPDDGALHYGDTAAVLFTSGTTGRAKGVMQSHNVWLKAAWNGARTSGMREGDVLYNCLPTYQSAAWVANVFRALLAGAPCGMDPRFSASEFWDRCRHYGATMTFTLGAMHIFLWQAPERADDADNPVRVASAIPMPAALEEPFKKRFGLEAVVQGYGQSEAMTLFSRGVGRAWKPNTLGEPQEGVEIALLDDEDRPVARGETGEICARPTEPYALFNGYFGDPDATLRAFRNLWYHTGDLARRDEEGDYFFVDRKADYIRYKGRNLSSFAVEAAVAAHPAVAQVAAHGVPSRELESEAELKVAVVVKPGARLTAEELARFVNETAPYFFVPRYVEFVDALPHTPTGRVQKYKLRERGVTPETWDAVAAGFRVQR